MLVPFSQPSARALLRFDIGREGSNSLDGLNAQLVWLPLQLRPEPSSCKLPAKATLREPGNECNSMCLLLWHCGRETIWFVW